MFIRIIIRNNINYTYVHNLCKCMYIPNACILPDLTQVRIYNFHLHSLCCVCLGNRERGSSSGTFQGSPCEWNWDDLEARNVTPPFKPHLVS